MTSAFSFLPSWPASFGLVFWCGCAFLAAGALGEIGWQRWRLPRVTVYGLIGLLAGGAGFGLDTPGLQGGARLAIDLALGLLLFELGSRVSLRWIRHNPWLIATSIAESALTFGAVLAALLLLRYPLLVSLVAAGIAISTSPSLVVQLRAELRSEGQVTERVLTLAALNSAYAVVVVKLISAGLHQTFYGNVFATLLQPVYLLLGSLLLAYVMARCCHLLLRRLPPQDGHASVALLGLVMVTIALAQLLQLSTVLTLLAAGICCKNFVERPQLWPQRFGSVGWLLTVGMFMLTMLPFTWRDAALGGVGALALLLVRFVAKGAACAAFARPSGISLRQGLALGASLAPMSALALVLVDDSYRLYPHLDPSLRGIVITALVIAQLLTPFLLYRCLSLVGERAAPTEY
ncbi:cation:proton antiporter [Chitinasiproducens palmae]|uniref:Kef-type K+ transport system, membrane component KefB n=1 Tax=Chitinasiproducens palmae TaxID=1770053 RepID=A0A1H2PP44_9BURK|nr:cation:proton antiporter [Chitinasiproducens palmae]SDV48496.1 Kef-type K+ transport system, membrane component KefB [Chitinasiproducens palmae]